MSVLFMDGFSHYALGDILGKWTAKNDTNTIWTMEPAGGRTAGCLRKTATSNAGGGFLVKGPTVRQGAVWTPQQSGRVGFAINVTDLNRIGTVGSGAGILTVLNGATGQFTVCLNPDGTFSVWKIADYPPANTNLATSISGVNSGTWSYIEILWTLDVSVGNLIIRSNMTEILNYTGRLLFEPVVGAPPPALWTSVRLFATPSAVPPYLSFKVCDLYISDLVPPNGTFLGDISIAYIIPDAVGATTAWTPTPGVPNWQNVNEVPPNGDTSYNSALAIDSVDLYSFTPVTVNPTAIQHCIYDRRVSPGSSLIQSVARVGGVNLMQPTQSVQNELIYAYNLFPYDTNPATGIKWTQTEMNASEFGVNKAT